jgi:DNA-binding NtrC family response regulator
LGCADVLKAQYHTYELGNDARKSGLKLAGGPEVISNNPISKRLILCVAQDQAVLRYEQALLERAGYAVLTAASAQQALRLVTMCECDAVLLEYEMFDLGADEIALQIKRVRPELTIILLSGSEVPAYALVVVDAVVPKLEASRQLLPMIAELCARNHDTRQRQGNSKLQIADDRSQPSPRGFFEDSPPYLQSLQAREEDS